jgi:Ala-tRNA(Pro) deacylase
MNKEMIYDYLNKKNIRYELIEHEAVYTMEDLSKLDIPYPDSDAKNLFVCDDKKENYYLITVKNNKRVNLKDFQKEYHTRPLSFASSDDLFTFLKLTPGAVTPFGLLNDKNLKVKFYLDKEFLDGNLIAVHPNDNTATVWLKVEDLIDIIRKHGNMVDIIQL